MKMLVSRRVKNRFLTPMRVGFVVSLLVHLAVLCFFMDKFHSVDIKEEGINMMTLSLSTIQNPSPNEAKPTPKKPKKKIHKKTKPKQVMPSPIPEEIVQEEIVESTLAKQAQQENQADMIETLSYRDGQNNELYQQIQRAIAKKQKYPRMMLKRKLEDEVLIEFVIYTDGRVTNIRLIQPSKYDDFNRASVRAIQEASKHFPRVEKKLRLEIPLAYNLDL